MIRTAVGFLGLLALLPALQARDKPEKQTPAQQYRALIQEYSKAVMAFQKAYKEAKTPSDKQKVIREKYPQPDKFAPRFLELAEKHPKDPAAVNALMWIASNSNARTSSGPDSPRTKALVLLRDHVRSTKIAAVCQSLANARDEESEQLLRIVLEKNRTRSAQAQACLALAQVTENRLNLRQELLDPETAKRYEASLGKEKVDKLVKTDPDEFIKEAEKLYKRVLKSFAAAPYFREGTMGKFAEKRLEALDHIILVGRPAPEIKGEDIDGKTFKLSDYRGKVVLLDFWGHW